MRKSRKFYITKTQVEKAKKPDIWEFSNKVLYDLCEKYPKHDDLEVTVAKICIIGRIYAATLERRKKQDKPIDKDQLYKEVATKLKKDTQIRRSIVALRRKRSIENNKEIILKTHKKLVDIFEGLTSMEKHSLASKYLHFHAPKLFFIYDKHAREGFSAICPNYRTTRRRSGQFDDKYENFFLKMLDLQSWITKTFNEALLPRELDRLLLKKYEKHKRKNRKANN